MWKRGRNTGTSVGVPERSKDSLFLAQDLFNDAASHIGQAKVSPVVKIGESLVVHAQQMKNGGMNVMDGNWIGCGFEPDLISLSVTHPAFRATSRHPHQETMR